MGRRHVVAASVVAAVLLAGCDSDRATTDASADARSDVDGRADADLLDAEVGPDVETDVVDERGEAEPGQLTLLAAESEVIAERLFDLDGDGTLDNAVAELGSPASTLYASVFTAASQAYIDDGRRRTILHLPFVDDLATPHDDDAPAAIFEGLGLDEPDDFADDFSGEEPFWVNGEYVDACGEPRFALQESRIEAGVFTGRVDRARLTFGELGSAYGVQVAGTIAPDGAAADLNIGMYVVASEIGNASEPTTGLSNLEFFLAGGGPHGISGVPGISPDIDRDGDGLERFVLGEDWRLVECIDGDSTVIPGADCWQDSRIADGFSFTFRMVFVPAVLAGLQPDWESVAVGTCDEPPAESFWSPGRG